MISIAYSGLTPPSRHDSIMTSTDLARCHSKRDLQENVYHFARLPDRVCAVILQERSFYIPTLLCHFKSTRAHALLFFTTSALPLSRTSPSTYTCTIPTTTTAGVFPSSTAITAIMFTSRTLAMPFRCTPIITQGSHRRSISEGNMSQLRLSPSLQLRHIRNGEVVGSLLMLPLSNIRL